MQRVERAATAGMKKFVFIPRPSGYIEGMYYLNSMKFKQKEGHFKRKRNLEFAKEIKRVHRQNVVEEGSDYLPIMQLKS